MSILRPHLAALKPYVPTPPQPGFRLHLNEAPEDLPADVKRAAVERLLGLNWSHYPEEIQLLAAELAMVDGWRSDGVVIGNGSNEMLQVLIYASLSPGDPIVVGAPSFSVYATQVKIANAKLIEVPLRSDKHEPFEIDVKQFARAAKASNARVTIIGSPNNPTGTLVSAEDVRWLHDEIPGLLVVDEAYRHFCGQDFAPLLQDCPRLLLMRTFSKSFAAAALRLGYMLTAPDIATDLNKVVMPYNLNIISISLARELLHRRELVAERIRYVVGERDRMAAELAKLPQLRVEKSAANFVVLEHATKLATPLAEELSRRGILVRDLSGYVGCDHCLRVSVGTPDANAAFLAAMRELV
jgi:histidinol-phosphate aminotransferase